MRRLYKNAHLALIAALLLVAVAFEAAADHRAGLRDLGAGWPALFRSGR